MEKNKKKYCEYCKIYITQTNFTTHKKREKHIKNKNNYKPVDILELNDKDNVKYIRIQLEDIKNDIDNILKNIK